MNYLRGFVPWIAFAVVSSAGWQWGASAALVIGGWLLVRDRQAGEEAGAKILEISTVVFFALLTAFAFARPDSGLQHWSGALSLGWLGLTAWATLAAGRPFTTGIARKQAPSEVWHTPLFRRINVVITAFWAASFTLTAGAVTAISSAGFGSTVSTLAQIAGFVVAAVFTARYPARAAARSVHA
ncbi:hypothetical protein [Streptomyces sp. NBC_00344]|uniref:hypothetical protein n=1 Tax=Streptomyces sp. NBC_00344 TaxID=2975720 RepID=UPI002E20D4F3